MRKHIAHSMEKRAFLIYVVVGGGVDLVVVVVVVLLASVRSGLACCGFFCEL